jgi:hypothetical protein
VGDRLPVDVNIIVADILNLSTEGPAKVIETLGKEKDMKVTYDWCCSEYDDNRS